MSDASLTRPAIRYHGGKWLLAPWIIGHLPAHECYVEPFGGGASVLLRKAAAPIEVYNDLDGEVVNFFRILRSRTEDLVRAVALTPYSRAEQVGAYEIAGDELERARRFFVLAWQSRGANRGNWRTGWRYMRVQTLRGQTPVDDWRDTERLFTIAARLRDICFECGPASEVIARFDAPSTLFYCDPPYVQSTRSLRWSETAYRFELTDEQHRALADQLHSVSGMVVLSGYHSPLYDELYSSWTSVERVSATEGGAAGARRRSAIEVLWLSPAAAAAARQGSLL